MKVSLSPEASHEFVHLEPEDVWVECRDVLASLTQRSTMPRDAVLISRSEQLYRFKFGFKLDSDAHALVIIVKLVAPDQVRVMRIRHQDADG